MDDRSVKLLPFKGNPPKYFHADALAGIRAERRMARHHVGDRWTDRNKGTDP